MNHVLDATIRREGQLLRFGTYLRNEYIKPAYLDLARQIPRLLVDYNELNQAEFRAVMRDVKSLIDNRLAVMFDEITTELGDLSEDEAKFIHDLYDDFAPDEIQVLAAGVASRRARNAVMSLSSQGQTKTGVWDEFITSNIIRNITEIDSIIRRGYRDGVTISQLTQELRGRYNRQTKEYQGGKLQTLSRYAETLARTGTSHYASMSRDAFADANKKVITKRIFFATLDNRTTTICFGNHLKEYDTDDKSYPKLPLHYNERSVYLFRTKSFDPLTDTRPAIGGKTGAKDKFEARQDRTDKKVRYRGRKDQDIFDVEQISAKVTSQQWLSRQPRWFIESTLGKTRAQLFIDGGLKIDKFTDLQGRPLTLAQLRETAAGERAFRRAGLD